MFNAPRANQRYGATSNTGFGGSFVAENPLSSSVYDDGLDPWSATPSPSATPVPPTTSSSNAIIADATVPLIYQQAFNAVDPNNTGETSVSSLSRVLATSSLPASTIERIVNLVSSRTRVSRIEFFVALALVALAQAGEQLSIEQVGALAAQNTMPEPTLDLDALQPSTSTFSPPSGLRKDSDVRTPVPGYSSVDPWNSNINGRYPGPGGQGITGFETRSSNATTNGNGSSTIAGTGLPKEWWKRQESVLISVLGQQGFILNRYTMYQITTDRGPAVPRRYSEFVFLWDCLTRRYPFRLFPSLPPKRLGTDEYFIEQRRRGLIRCINFVINHPIIKEDSLLAIFLTEPSFEEWRKHASVSLDEESASKRVDKIEEMTIPSDLEEKMAIMRGKIAPLIDKWQRICILAERVIKRRESAAVRVQPFFRRMSLPAHQSPALVSSSASILSDSATTHTMTSSTIGESIFGSLPFVPHHIEPEQSDMSRLTNTLRAVVEVNERCWRGDECELSQGVRNGLEEAATHAQRFSEMSETRTRALLDTTLESLKTQRDLYLALRDFFIRYDRLSIDQVERLKKRVDANSLKMEGVKVAQKDGWQDEVDKYVALIEKDQATIAAQLSRRIFIRACIWHELRVVLHNRENTLITGAVQSFAREEADFSEHVLNNWVSLQESVESMPYE